MVASEQGKETGADPLSPITARAKLEEQLGKLDIMEAEATPLVIDDREEGPQKWMLAGRVLLQNVFHI
jgi:hypothetical protein